MTDRRSSGVTAIPLPRRVVGARATFFSVPNLFVRNFFAPKQVPKHVPQQIPQQVPKQGVASVTAWGA